MSVLYEDNYIVCDDDAITIHWYYFPIGSKRLSYIDIRSVQEENLGFWTGAGRIWGMGLSPEWFHLDPNRPSKTRCIVIDEGSWVKSAITPDDHDRVLRILREKTSLAN
jgi:hypothetical protein